MAHTNDITNAAFQLATDFVDHSNTSLFLTGKAGTGKTTFLKQVKANNNKNTVVVAPTGVAAINAGGTTIHSFFQLPFAPFLPVNKSNDSNDNLSDKHSLLSQQRLTKERKEVLQQMELLIIDEVSMVRCDVIDAIDTVLRHVRNRYAVPFGGVQVIFIGDLYQLPPVIKNEEWQWLAPHYKSQYFFDSHVMQALQPVYIELNKIYRQKDDRFVQLLNLVRNNEMDKASFELLHTRYLPDFEPSKEENYITLTTHNNKADAINFKALKELKGAENSFTAVIEGDFYEKAYPAEVQLKLKVGTQVMFLKNDAEKPRRYFNGKIGVVEKMDTDKILIRCKGEALDIEVKKEKWKNIRYSLNKSNHQIEEEEIGSFTQFPLRLAWAITIHKSQGLTFEKAIIDAGEAFAAGQVYVALSRCTTLEGMILHSRINNNSLRNDQRIAHFTKTQEMAGAKLALLHEAKRSYQKSVITKLFDFAEIALMAQEMVDFMADHSFNFTTDAQNWIQQLHQQIHSMEQVAIKFQLQLRTLMNEASLPENNESLQIRIKAASLHFQTSLAQILALLSTGKACTNNKASAVEGNKMLTTIFQALQERQFLLKECVQGFDAIGLQTHKRNFVSVALRVNLYAGKAGAAQNDSPNPDLYFLLCKTRDALCTKKNIPIAMVANTVSLDEMARYLPQSFEEISMITKFGKAKTAQFGEAFLSVIQSFCEENNLSGNIQAMPGKTKRKGKSTESSNNPIEFL